MGAETGREVMASSGTAASSAWEGREIIPEKGTFHLGFEVLVGVGWTEEMSVSES